MKTKVVTVPADVVVDVVDRRGNQIQSTFSFCGKGGYLDKLLDGDRFGAPRSARRIADRIADAFDDVAVGDRVTLFAEEHAMLSAEADSPQPPMNAAVIRRCPTFPDAIMDAEDGE